MNRLLHAGFYRFIKNKIYIGCTLTILSYCIFIYVVQYIHMTQSGTHYFFDPLLFSFLMIYGIVIAVFISLFIGTEFSDGTIRNKLIAGFSKTSIYFSNLLTGIIAETLMILTIYLIGTILGVILFGPIELEMKQFISIVINSIFIGAAYVAIFNMITMLSANKAYAATICILTSFGMIFISIALYRILAQPEFIQETITKDAKTVIETVKNSNYLVGKKRMIYQFILDFLPYGQTIQLLNTAKTQVIKLVETVTESIVISILGAYLFSRKDIK